MRLRTDPRAPLSSGGNRIQPAIIGSLVEMVMMMLSLRADEDSGDFVPIQLLEYAIPPPAPAPPEPKIRALWC